MGTPEKRHSTELGVMILGVVLFGFGVVMTLVAMGAAGPDQRMGALLFTGVIPVLGLALFGISFGRAMRSRRARRTRIWLLELGTRVPGVLVDVTARELSENDSSPWYRMTYESRAGGRNLRVVELSNDAPSVGRTVTIAFDEADPRRAVVVESYEDEVRELAQRLRDEQRAEVRRLLAETEDA
jgi:hypothetical protein